MGVVRDMLREKLYRFQRKAPPLPSTEETPAPSIVEAAQNERFLWGRPRFTNEGRVGNFHLFNELTPRKAVCGYEPSRKSITINEAVTFAVAQKRADEKGFCFHCLKWADRTGIGYEAVTSNDVPERQLSV
jgi:hypothetical protein